MKQLGFLIFIAIILALGCKKETEIYSFYRPTNPQNFKTIGGGELYAFAANDTVLLRADYYMKVMGQMKIYGSEILQYGFCWHPERAFPVIGIDTLMTINGSGDPNLPGKIDTLSFTMALTRLKPDTRYFIRSYIITGDGAGNPVDTGYNPVVLEKKTKAAIDEWFLVEGSINKPTGARFDAVAFNLGDTVFFGTGDQGKNSLTKDISMYDPQTGAWSSLTSLISIQLPATLQYKDKITDAVGFAIRFHDKNAPQNEFVKCIYVGLGDYGGDDKYDDKSRTLLEYNLAQGTWRETSNFFGGIRSGAVSFVIGARAYVGTGSNISPTSTWYVFDPSNDRDGDNSTFGWLQIPSPTDINRVGAVAFAINGKGYFGLGRDDSGNFLNDFWEFKPNETNPILGTWKKMKSFPGTPRANASAFVIGDQGYVGTGDNIIGDMESDPPTYTGQLFHDFYRYDPFNDRWIKQADFPTNKTDRTNNPKNLTRGVGYSIQKDKVGFIGFGIVPTDSNRAQDSVWRYQPYDISGR